MKHLFKKYPNADIHGLYENLHFLYLYNSLYTFVYKYVHIICIYKSKHTPSIIHKYPSVIPQHFPPPSIMLSPPYFIILCIKVNMLHIKYLTTAGFIRSNTIVRWLGTRSEKLAVNSCSTFGIYVGFSFAFCEHFEFMFVWPIYNLVHVNLLFLFAFNLLLNMKILQRNSCKILSSYTENGSWRNAKRGERNPN